MNLEIFNRANSFYKMLYSKPQSFNNKLAGQIAAKKHLLDCLNSPTTAFVARHQAKKSNDNSLVKNNIINNMQILRRDYSVSIFQELVDSKVKKLYPKTLAARQYMIQNEHVVFDSVKPKSNTKFKDRVNIVLQKLINRILDIS